MPLMGYGSDLYRKVEAKTADYRMTYLDLGKIITNRGASGAVTLTLPPQSVLETGWWVDVFAAADFDVTVASDTADTMTVFNDLTADSIAWSTGGEILGAAARLIWDGTGWLTQLFTEKSQTTTVATA